MTPDKKIAEGLRANGRHWAKTTDCARLLLLAKRNQAHHTSALELLDAYGKHARCAAERGARDLEAEYRAQRTRDIPQELAQWAAENAPRFAPSSSGEPRRGWWGRWDDQDGCLWVRTEIVRDVLAGWGLEPKEAIQQLARIGCIRRWKVARPTHLARQLKIGSFRGRFYGLRLVRVDRHAEADLGIIDRATDEEDGTVLRMVPADRPETAQTPH